MSAESSEKQATVSTPVPWAGKRVFDQRILRKICAALLSLPLIMIPIGVGSTPAYAHYVYEYGSVTGGNECHGTRSEISHGGGAGYVSVTSRSFPSSCNSFVVKDHRARWNLWKQDASSGSWAICRTSGFVYSSSVVHGFVINHDFGSGNPPCGIGFYENRGHSAHRLSGSQWLTANVWSGDHGLPPCIETNSC